MKLYFHPMSGCSRRVLAVAAHLGIELEPLMVNLQKGEQKAPEYLALNPNGRVPTLVDEDFVLWESVAIVRYLVERIDASLLGNTVREKAEVDRWSTWGVAHFAAALSALNQETGLKKMRGLKPDPETVERLTQAAHDAVKILNTQLGEHQYVAGDRLTVVDFILAPSLESSLGLAQFDLTSHSSVAAWLQHITSSKTWPKLVRPQ